MKISVVENVLKLNDEVAAMNRETLGAAGVFAIDLIGAPGAGKTATIEATMRKLGDSLKVAVCVGDLTTQRDADRMAKYCDQVVQINTGKGCHLDANQVKQAINQIDLEKVDLLIIENVGNLICPVGFDLGQDVKVGIFGVSEGDDKAAKHPYLVQAASVILLNKKDLLPYIPFDIDKFKNDISNLNDAVEVIDISALNDDTMDRWIEWLKSYAGK